MTVTPEMLAKAGSEHAHQTALFCWAALPEQRERWPELELMFAIPNGGERNFKVASQLKAEGVKAGVLDIFLPAPRSCWHGLFIEMKKRPNKVTPEQLMFAQRVSANGYQTALCYTWLEAVAALETYLTLR